ncbi:hypothetical protein HWV62_33617 [Athelia sp. TMB]|nr:hypothetical protein HWV62_33617 [Athelia sp. TMB]
MSGRTRKRPAFEWHPSNANRGPDGQPPTVRLRHADITIISDAGPSSVHSSIITAPASPTKAPAVDFVYRDDYLLHQMARNWDVEVDNGLAPDPPEERVQERVEDAFEPAMDPQYLLHIQDNVAGTEEAVAEAEKAAAGTGKTAAGAGKAAAGAGKAAAGAEKPRPKRVQINPLRTWLLQDREEFLLELLLRDGRRGHGSRCGRCNLVDGTLRCKDCHGGQILCKACLLINHQVQPLHRVETWNGTYFEKTTLKSMGLTMQLGHSVGQRCVHPKPAPGEGFTILDLSGIHDVALAFCACSTARSDTIQLLRAGLYPATTQAPETAITINALEYFHMLTFESKTSVFEFHNTLARLTDNTGTEEVPDRYEELLRIIREWRNLKLLKRAGRGHDPAGVSATKEGECAVLCPACPQPGKNLDFNWRDAPETIRYLFALFLGNDANFRMVRKKVSSEAADPSLSEGWSYFCEMTKYRDHLAKYGDQKEVHSTCVKHHAVNDANTSRFANLATSGIGTIDCARHMMKRPNSLGDLQKGEKYANMDYMFFSSITHPHDTLTHPPLLHTVQPPPCAETCITPRLHGSPVRSEMCVTPPPHGPESPLGSIADGDYAMIVVSYDIVCQWSVHIWERMKSLPTRLRIDREGTNFLFLIPKFHLPAHVEKCQTTYSFNLTPGVGRTEGEAPERGWSFIDPLSTSTKEMGPASYRETIDDHFGDWNHKRVIKLGKLLMRRVKVAVAGRDDHVKDYYAFTDSLPATSVLEWQTWVETWEKRPDSTNPFVPTTKKVTQHAVRLALAEEDAAHLKADEVSSVHDEVTPGLFIAQGLDLESQQLRVKADKKALDASATSLQLAKMQERQNSLLRKIKTWMAIQLLYMPEVSPLRAAEDRVSSAQQVKSESFNIPLHLPSALPRRIRVQAILYEYEFRLRRAQAYECLDNLRGHLRMRTHMYQFKDRNVRGQGACTRSVNLISRVKKKVDASAAQYRAARVALFALSARTGDYAWASSLRELNEADVRAFTDDSDGETQAERLKREKREEKTGKALGEGFKKLSWIWMITGVGADGDDAGLQEALRIQWCKARARAMRWSEEVLLIREEMSRVLAFLSWHSVWWDRQVGRRTDLTPEAAEGVSAYAHRQAAIRRKIRSSFDILWTTGWDSIVQGVGANNGVLNLPSGSSSFITSYPPPLKKKIPALTSVSS